MLEAIKYNLARLADFTGARTGRRSGGTFCSW